MNESVSGANARIPERRWRSRHWRALCGVLAMITALAVVWAILASLTIRQRERDLTNAAEDIELLRAQLSEATGNDARAPSVTQLLETFLSEEPPPQDPTAAGSDDILDALEEETERLLQE